MQRERDYQTNCVYYIPAILFYLVSIFLTLGFFCSFAIDKNINIILRIIGIIIFLFFLVFTLYYHYKSMKIDNRIDYDNALLNSQEENGENEEQKENNYCKTCKVNRPKRAHHCRICGVCILKMDHHCPWISNCIGEKNEREFIYFLFGSTISCIFVFLLTLKYFFTEILYNGKNNYNYKDTNFTMMMKDIISTMKYGSCIISFVVGFCSFFITYSYIFNNVKYNLTSVEMLIYKKNEECPYYINNLEENLKRKLKPYPLINYFYNESDDINDDLKYKNFNEENEKLLNKEKDI